MTELEKLEYAKTFIDKLASGINPIDNSPIPEGEVANNVRISRCFFYVSDILRQVIENGGDHASYYAANENTFTGYVTEYVDAFYAFMD